MISLNTVRVQQLLIISMLGVCLSGCVGMSSKFDCNVDSGGRCVPMHKINKMANYGAFNNFSYPSYLPENKAKQYHQKYSYAHFKDAPIRSNEKIQQIWIGPYEDTNGDYHEGSYVYSVVKKGSWTGTSNQMLKTTE